MRELKIFIYEGGRNCMISPSDTSTLRV